MQINDGVSPGRLRPSLPRVEGPRVPPAPADGARLKEPGGQELFSPPPAQPPTPPPPAAPSVPTTLAEARQRVYDDALEAATPPVLHRLPPEDRADVLGYAAAQAEHAVAVFDELYRAASPVDARELRHLPPEDAQEIRRQAVEGAWRAYQVLAVDGPPVGTPAGAGAVVDRAVHQTEALVEQAASLSPQLREALVGQILAGTEGLETRIADETSRALGDRFPALLDFYGEQGRRFTEMLRNGIRAAAQSALAPAPAPADAVASLERLQGRYEAMRADIAVVSGFDGVEAGLDAFGITLGRDGTGAEWTDAQREQVLAQAVRIENAFRAADADGLLSRFGPGEAFDALFASRGDITLNTIPERHGCNRDDVPVITGGAITCSSELVEYRTFSSDQTWDGMANSRQYHFAHEFGHALNASLAGAYRGLGVDDRSPYQVIDDAAEGLPDPSQRDWDDPAWGLPMRDVQGTPVRSPYQQNTTASNGEYFADTFANWANGTLLDNEAGRALQAWMDRMAPEWIRTRLAASGLLEPPPADDGGEGPF